MEKCLSKLMHITAGLPLYGIAMLNNQFISRHANCYKYRMLRKGCFLKSLNGQVNIKAALISLFFVRRLNMKSRLLTGIALFFLVLGITGVSQAALNTIGAAYCGGSFFGLIYDDDQNLVWLNYTNPYNTWMAQMDWIGDLNSDGALRYAWFPEYADFTWDGEWRLPSAGENPQSGSNQTTTEMGHLFYIGLGIKDWNGRQGNFVTSAELNSSEFKNTLVLGKYWTDTRHKTTFTNGAYVFNMHTGEQNNLSIYSDAFGLAVRSGHFSSVPVPGTILLLASGLMGLAGFSRKKNE